MTAAGEAQHRRSKGKLMGSDRPKNTSGAKKEPTDEGKNIGQNIDFLFKELGQNSLKSFGSKFGVSDDTAGRWIKSGTRSFDDTITIERAFELRTNSLRLPHDKFVEYFKNRLTDPPPLPQSQSVESSWGKTLEFAKKIKTLEPIFLYYWSTVDKAIIANQCKLTFAPDTGVAFSFNNPCHEGPNSPTKIGELEFSGHLRLIGNAITFEVYSHEPVPEPASGVGTPGTATAPGIARGRMVGFQTHIKGENFITDFKFILLSKPVEKLRKTDRIPREDVVEPLLAFFEDELK
jgi:hypothetical protein